MGFSAGSNKTQGFTGADFTMNGEVGSVMYITTLVANRSEQDRSAEGGMD